MFNLKIVRKDTMQVLENNIRELKKTIDSKERSIKGLMSRIDEVIEDKQELDTYVSKYRNTLRVVDNIISNPDKAITTTNKINQIAIQIKNSLEA